MELGKNIGQIKLLATEDVKDFCALMSQVESDVNLHCDRYKIDAKSIMGVLTLDRSKALTVSVIEKNEGDIEAILQKIEKYLVK